MLYMYTLSRLKLHYMFQAISCILDLYTYINTNYVHIHTYVQWDRQYTNVANSSKLIL